ncbi:hypothetical protein ACFQJC_16210 [Haloferax namakaokahaiae]|uniref:Uncharacterized protein n=1 Tax=Haloferax namakaokahaiae TaxID=1748331 RepID=A0ABD5ZIG7_9EURY
MLPDRGKLEADSLVRIVLVLVLIWVGLEIVGEILDLFSWLLGPLRPLLGLVVIAIIVLWLLDRI